MVQIIITAVNVFLLFFLIGYVVSDMVDGLLAKRKHRIVEDISTAKMSKEEALALKNDYAERLANFEQEREAILSSANQKAALAEEKIMTDGKEEAKRLIIRAKREADLMKAKLQDDVKRDMIMAASVAAGKLIAENLDTDKQAAYVQEMLDGMGESTWQV